MWETIMNYEYLYSVALSLGIFLLFLIFRKIFTKYIFQIILKIMKKTPSKLFSHIWLSFENPIRWLFVIIGIYVAVGFFPYIDQQNTLFVNLIRASVIMMITWGLVNIASASSIALMKLNEMTSFEIDEILIPFLSKAIRVIIVLVSLSIIAQEFGYDVSGFVAGLGLGGLAFALAAQDVLKNLFGGIVIITEKPFSIGDWIMTSSVEGTVEDISFRNTKVRTFAQALVVVPNSKLAEDTITNWSKMGKRRITFNLGVTYDTPREKLKLTVDRIESMLRNHPDIHQETIFVTFDTYNVNSLDIFLYFFTNTTVWSEFLQVKQDVNFKIMEILESEGVEVAFPTRTVITTPEGESKFKEMLPTKENMLDGE